MVEVYQQMNPSRSGLDFLDRFHVRFARYLTTDDQLVVPNFDAIRPLEGFAFFTNKFPEY